METYEWIQAIRPFFALALEWALEWHDRPVYMTYQVEASFIILETPYVYGTGPHFRMT